MMYKKYSWAPKWISFLIPRYGNYGGPGQGDPYGVVSPVDEMDGLFKEHDRIWLEGNHIKADKILATQLRRLNHNPRLWNPPAKNVIWARIYRRAALIIFNKT